jgi:flagellar hook assembly protein FlgD
LRGNSPNPFNPSTRIDFEIRSPGRVKVELYDIRGRLVETLLAGRLFAGRHTVLWDGDDRRGRPAPSGIYFCRLVTGGGSDTRKLTLIR